MLFVLTISVRFLSSVFVVVLAYVKMKLLILVILHDFSYMTLFVIVTTYVPCHLPLFKNV